MSSAMLPPEWARQECVLIAWPHVDTDWGYMLDEVVDCYVRVAQSICRYAKLVVVTPHIVDPLLAIDFSLDPKQLILHRVDTNDTWARDFGMICVKDNEGNVSINDYKFNGWGLKFASNFDNLITSRLIKCNAVNKEVGYNNLLNFVLEGGSIDIDENGMLLTTEECLLSPNRNGASTKKEIEQVLKDTLGAKKVLWLKHGALEGDDTDSHIDTLARFLPGGKIAYTTCDREDDEEFEELDAMRVELEKIAEKYGKKLVPLPIPNPIYDADGQRLPATYANFLLLNGAVLLPVYGDKRYDNKAIKSMKKALPDWEIVPIDCHALIQQHGSLHCITMQIPHGVIDVEKNIINPHGKTKKN